MPGTILLKIARLLFSKDVLSAVVQPTISDLQHEVANAASSRTARLHARWRGYRAFWTLTLLAPFASWPSPANADGVAFPDPAARLAVGSTLLTLLAVGGAAFRAWAALVAAAGALFAIVIHVWYRRHPTAIPAPAESQRRVPQINFSLMRCSFETR